MKLNDTLEERYNRLLPKIKIFGPDDDLPRPAVVMLHGCGGHRPHIDLYAQAVAKLGVRAFVVDSFGARGWDRMFNVSLICTGVVMQGYERSGDVLAVLWGLKQRKDVDSSQIILMGESHGGWAISDLMTQKLKRPGEARIQDPDSTLLDGVKGLFLIYPYLNFPARTNGSRWQHSPKTFAVLAAKDHLTPLSLADKLLDRLETEGVVVERLKLQATHAFDEVENAQGGIMRYDAEATKATTLAIVRFSSEVFNLEGGAKDQELNDEKATDKADIVDVKPLLKTGSN